MKKLIIAFVAIGLTACMGSRPYDGFIGYKSQTSPSGIQITDIEQRSTKSETMLQRMKTICAKQLNTDESKVHIEVLSETTYTKSVDMDVRIPEGMRDIGPRHSSSASTGGTVSISQTSTVQHNMKIREITVSCTSQN